jgi:hypothetical protein
VGFSTRNALVSCDDFLRGRGSGECLKVTKQCRCYEYEGDSSRLRDFGRAGSKDSSKLRIRYGGGE